MIVCDNGDWCWVVVVVSDREVLWMGGGWRRLWCPWVVDGGGG